MGGYFYIDDIVNRWNKLAEDEAYVIFIEPYYQWRNNKKSAHSCIQSKSTGSWGVIPFSMRGRYLFCEQDKLNRISGLREHLEPSGIFQSLKSPRSGVSLARLVAALDGQQVTPELEAHHLNVKPASNGSDNIVMMYPDDHQEWHVWNDDRRDGGELLEWCSDGPARPELAYVKTKEDYWRARPWLRPGYWKANQT